MTIYRRFSKERGRGGARPYRTISRKLGGTGVCPSFLQHIDGRDARPTLLATRRNRQKDGTRTFFVPEILYQRFELLQRKHTRPPQFFGGFVVGVPLHDFEEAQKSNSFDSDATIFDALVGADWETIKLCLDMESPRNSRSRAKRLSGGCRGDERL
jgi:hypothetical protein